MLRLLQIQEDGYRGQNPSFTGLSAHSEVDRHRHFFIFLGGDAELSYPFLTPEDHPDATKLNRALVLKVLSVIFLYCQQRKEDAEGYRAMWAKEVWFAEQLWKHIPKEARLQLLADREVYEMDPNFCFYKAVFGEDPKPFPALPTGPIAAGQ